jgi:hypothetical protein
MGLKLRELQCEVTLTAMKWRETAYYEESWQASALQLSRQSHNFNVDGGNSSCYASGARLTLRPSQSLLCHPEINPEVLSPVEIVAEINLVLEKE